MSAIALFSPISGSTTAFGAIIPACYEDEALVNDSVCSPSCFDHDGAIRQYIGTTRLPSHHHPRPQRSLRRRGHPVQDGWRCRPAFDGTNIWVTNEDSNNMMKLRASDGAVLETFTVGTLPLQVAFDGANIWVTNGRSGSVSKLKK